MSDDKKPGFFKRLFGFGQSAPAPEAPPPPPPAAPPLVDEAAERIAREIEEARAAAAEAEALAKAEQLASEEAARKAEEAAEAKRLAEEQEAADKAAREHAAAQARAAEIRAELECAEAARIGEEKRAAAEAEKARAAAEEIEAARLQKLRLDAEQAAAVKAEAERLAIAKEAEAARIAAEQAAAARLEKERQEAEQLAAAEKLALEEAEKAKAARAEEARVEAARIETERAEAAKAAADALAAQEAEAAPVQKASWWQKLKSGLSRTASTVSEGITGLFTKRKLDDETLEELEDLLIQADLGIDVAARISAAVGKGRYDKEIEPSEVKAILAEEVAKVLAPVAMPLVVDSTKTPFVILMVGVNGSGKTTTIGKLASKFRAEGKSVMLAAGDTFRAAAIEQLKVWGERTGAPVISRDQGADAAGLAFDALKAAREQGTDVLLVDTAGRLQNRTELMAELEKVVRVLKKMDDAAPHAVLLVLDATVGQNALSQVEIFGKTAGVTGLVMTKLDGTARGGILVAISEKFKMPVHFIGVGEGVDDLEPFAAQDFARAIAGLERLA